MPAKLKPPAEQVPLQQPPTSADAETLGPERPKKVAKISWDGNLPPWDAAVHAMPTMCYIIAALQEQLPGKLAEIGDCNSHVVNQNVWQVPPLAIKATGTAADGELTSFKAPWDATQCKHAVATTGLYEAACNIFWLDSCHVTRIPFEFPATRVAWCLVYDLQDRLFSEKALGIAGVTANASNRLHFPMTLPAFVLDHSLLEQSTFNQSLVLAGGHALVHAWFLGMWLALKEKNMNLIRRLWECGLTVSVRLRKADQNDPRCVILDSLNYSEACQAAQIASTDSFGVFTQKLQAFFVAAKKENPRATQDAITKYLAKQGVRFKGAPMNATMFKMAKGLHDASDDIVRQEMEQLEWKYGPDLLSSSYNKVGRLVHHCQKVLCSAQGIELDEALAFVLRLMHFVVATEQVQRGARFFTMDVAW